MRFLFCCFIFFLSLSAETRSFFAVSDFNLGEGAVSPTVQKILDCTRDENDEFSRPVYGHGDYWEAERGVGKIDPASQSILFKQEILDPFLQEGGTFIPALGNHDSVLKKPKEHSCQFWKEAGHRPELEYPLLEDGFSCEEDYPKKYCHVEEGVLHVILDDSCYGNLCQQTEQIEWLKRVFRLKEKEFIPVVVHGHIPLLSTSRKRSSSKEPYDNGQLGLDSEFPVLLARYADVFITGHSHAPSAGVLVHKASGHSVKIVTLPCMAGYARYPLPNSGVKRFFGYAKFRVQRDKFNKASVNYNFFEYSNSSQSCSVYPNENASRNIPTLPSSSAFRYIRDVENL